MQHENEVIFTMQNGIAHILLNRPRALNALSITMIKQISHQLTEWEHQCEVAIVLIEGAGEKGLCAGGDIKSLYEKKDLDAEAFAEDFLSSEYRMNLQLHRYSKPIVAYMNGIVMGGGIGISVYSQHRIVTEQSKLSMPELSIGFFPDVGASYFLNLMPGHMGRYLALTAHIFNGADAIYLGAADHYMNINRWGDLKEQLVSFDWTSCADSDTASNKLLNLIQDNEVKQVPDSMLAAMQMKVDVHFAYSSVQDILTSLDCAATGGDEWAKDTANTMRSKSPISLLVALEQLIRGKKLSIEDCLRMELIIARQFVRNYNFYEGVRSVLVDKDHNPRWVPATIDEVKREDVNAYFEA